MAALLVAGEGPASTAFFAKFSEIFRVLLTEAALQTQLGLQAAYLRMVHAFVEIGQVFILQQLKVGPAYRLASEHG